MNPYIGAAVFAIVFGALGMSATMIARSVCANIVPFDDGPKPGTPPVTWLVIGSALLGASLGWRDADPGHLALGAIVCFALTACWYCDVARGIVPDVFTLVPLAAILVAAAFTGEWWHAIAAFVPLVPFAGAALVSKGRGMGWGDAKLAALGGAVLGIGTSILAFAAACLAAVAIAALRGRRTEPIAFAPYLAGSVGLAVLFGMMP